MLAECMGPPLLLRAFLKKVAGCRGLAYVSESRLPLSRNKGVHKVYAHVAVGIRCRIFRDVHVARSSSAQTFNLTDFYASSKWVAEQLSVPLRGSNFGHRYAKALYQAGEAWRSSNKDSASQTLGHPSWPLPVTVSKQFSLLWRKAFTNHHHPLCRLFINRTPRMTRCISINMIYICSICISYQSTVYIT